MSDPTDDTRSEHTAPSDFADTEAPDVIGRYRIESVLGKGGFGTVYLAFDEELLRQVAIKVPRTLKSSSERFRDAFLTEARTLARLDHPHIVPVYDVGSTEDLHCYIVSKYIAGESLSRRMPDLNWSWQKRAEVVAAIAEALNFAHLAGLVHRDVKPANVLLDASDKPYLADFGLALSDADYQFSHSGARVGTLMYMSPEQVRGESHLVDGRADIFSLGVLMYEFLTGVRPFSGSSSEQVMQNILERDAPPLRQKNRAVPKVLERICLRALERQKGHRYSTANDMAEELHRFTASSENASASVQTERMHSDTIDTHRGSSNAAGTEADTQPSVNSMARAVAVVPKGLRSFESEDADFFLQILPGPKDSRGIPENIRFWKHRIESRDPDQTFRAGVIYGPSGCGKSSFVRAGLIPLLSPDVLPIVMSAMSNDTEERLQQSIVAACPDLKSVKGPGGLAEMLRVIRLGESGTSHRCVLLVIDQFEQWLNQGQSLDTKLIDALRQCDGVRLKCLFLVRNDFWMSISRVMEDLEAPIEQGKNASAVELFDLRHAQRVLFAFGHAYGALPETTDELSKLQREFLEESVQQLARDDRVICVRLAVYAQLIRDKAWEPKTLSDFGGVHGLGARFLEETFYGASAGPQYTQFQTQAQEVLRSLLPTPGSDIRGAMLSEQELGVVANLSNDRALKQLLRLLSDDLRLLTPTDAQGVQMALDSESSELQQPVRYYQLAHDYLVPSLRTWLNAKQRESATGRALLCLEDRAALWDINRESRQLPSMSETFRIACWTRPGEWTSTQAEMMKRAKQLRLLQLAAVGLSVILLLAVYFVGRSQLERNARQRRADSLVAQLKTARTTEVVPIIQELDSFSREGDAGLRASVQPLIASNSDAVRDAPGRDHSFRALLALSREPGPWTDQLLDACVEANSDSIVLAKDRLSPFVSEITPDIQRRLELAASRQAKLRFASLLPDSGASVLEGQDGLGREIAEALVEENPYDLTQFTDQLSESGESLLPSLIEIFRDSTRIETQRTAVARPLAKIADNETLVELLLTGSASQHFILISSLNHKRLQLADDVERALNPLRERTTLTTQDVQRISNGVITLLRWKPSSNLIEQFLSQQLDPSARTRVMLQCHAYGLPFEELWAALHEVKEPVTRQALILAIVEYRRDPRQLTGTDQVAQELQTLASSCPNQSIRSGAATVLRTWALDCPQPPMAFREPPDGGSDRNWWINQEGHAMVIIDQPVYADGPQALVFGREAQLAAGKPIDSHRFAISATEVTRESFLRKEPAKNFLVKGDNDESWPANNLYSLVAMRYCRWLSDLEKIPESEMCYPPIDEIEISHMNLTNEQLRKTSYRLPTEAEWEFACAAGSKTRWSHGTDESALTRFACYAANSGALLFPVASLYPNSWGLFDLHGNVSEWCHPTLSAAGKYALRGGNYTLPSARTTTQHLLYPGSKGYSFTGFRIARTIRNSSSSESSP